MTFYVYIDGKLGVHNYWGEISVGFLSDVYELVLIDFATLGHHVCSNW